MIQPTLSYSELASIAQNGSPLLVNAVGRVFGIGPAERRALGRAGAGGVPSWAWAGLAFVAGAVVGVRVYKRWPEHVPTLVQGD